MKIIFEKKKKRKKKGLWVNIHAKRKRGEKPAKPGDESYPDKKQWNKLTEEQLQEIISEEILNIFEEKELDPKAAAQQAVNDAAKMRDTAIKDLQAANNNAAVAQNVDPKLNDVARAEILAKTKNKKYADANLRDAKKKASQPTETETPEKPVTEQKSKFQIYVGKKNDEWKTNLITKGEQSAGSAYPDKAPTDRAKSAPPGAGGV